MAFKLIPYYCLNRLFSGSDSSPLSADREFDSKLSFIEGVSRNSDLTDKDRVTAEEMLPPLTVFKVQFKDWLRRAEGRYGQMAQILPEDARQAGNLFDQIEAKWEAEMKKG